VFDAEVRTRDGKLTPVAFRSLTNSTRRPFRIDVLG
jgi:hypothetical protein